MNDFLNQFYTENSISDNTILILFSDHGARFSGSFINFNFLFECFLNSELII